MKFYYFRTLGNDSTSVRCLPERSAPYQSHIKGMDPITPGQTATETIVIFPDQK